MPRSNRNLLEAFRDAGSSTPLESGASKGSAPPPREARVDRPPRASARRSDGGLPMALLLLIFVAVFSLGVLAGRSGMFGGAVAAGGGESGGDTAAAEPSTWIEPASRETAAGASGAAADSSFQPLTTSTAVQTPEQALLDKSNRYTAIAIYYDGLHETNQQRAREVLTHLRNQGFPSAVAYNYKNGIYVFVGASSERAVIDGIVQRLRQTPGPRGRMDFETAYTVNIDDHIKR